MLLWYQYLNAKFSLKYRQLYCMGLQNDKFKVWGGLWLTIFNPIYQLTVCFLLTYMLLMAGAINSSGYDANGL